MMRFMGNQKTKNKLERHDDILHAYHTVKKNKTTNGSILKNIVKSNTVTFGCLSPSSNLHIYYQFMTICFLYLDSNVHV